MPIFTYRCKSGHTFERINAPAKVKCHMCGAVAKAVEWELPAKRNPAHGMQMDMK